MTTPDLEVIKEIPGYKVILKAILKSQIQQLVEQLAVHTEEESVILTASVTDGTLSHLGSDSGKSFLQDHEDVKSQFLGFCLKKHHKKKEEEDRLEALRQAAQAPTYTPRPRYSPARSRNMPQHIRGRGVRPEPYPVSQIKVSRSPAVVQGTPADVSILNSSVDRSIKIEPVESPKIDENASSQIDSVVEAQNNTQSSIPSDPSMSTFEDLKHFEGVNDEAAAALDENSELSNISGDKGVSQEADSDSTITQEIKVEALSGADMELEITGVELGDNQDPQGSEDKWMADMIGTVGYDPTGATGNQSDFQQGYRKMDDSFELKGLDESFKEVTVATVLTCDICTYSTKKRFNFLRHMKVHQDRESPSESYQHLCGKCGKQYKSWVGMQHHVKKVHQHAFTYCCAICGKGYNGLANYRGHLASHDPALCEKCPKCNKTFRYRKSLLVHRKRCGKPDMPKVSCFQCDKEFVSQESLKQHTRVEHKHVNYRCKKCFKEFKWRSSLAYHAKRCKAQVVD